VLYIDAMRWEHQVSWKEPLPVLSIRETVPSEKVSQRIRELLKTVYEVAGDRATGVPFAMWHDVSGNEPHQTFDMEVGTPIFRGAEPSGPVQLSQLPGGNVLQVTYKGHYDGLSAAYKEVFEWMHANRYEPSGAPWDSYLDDPAKTGTDECRTLICWPVRVRH